MKKILIIRTFPSILDPNGYNIQEIGLAKALVRAGYICDVVLYNGKKDLVKEIPVPGKKDAKIKVYLKSGINILKNGFFPGLKKLTKEYDILQVNEYDQISSWMYYAFQKTKPVVIYHGPYYDDFNKGYNFKCRVFDNTFLKIRNGHDALAFTKSKAACGFLEKKGFENVYPLGVGLDTDNFSNELYSGIHEANIGYRDKDGDNNNSSNAGFAYIGADDKEKYSHDPALSRYMLDDKKWNLVYVGKIEPRRNPYLLLDVLGQLTDKYEDIHLTVIGSGEQTYIKEWKKKAIGFIENGKLTYIEKMSQAELQYVYKQAKLMIFPSNYEIFGMVILEAMFFNLPIVSSDNGGSDTLITDGVDGVIVDGFSTDAWKDAVADLYADKDKYLKIKKNLEEKDHSVYTWDGLAERYTDILKTKCIV